MGLTKWKIRLRAESRYVIVMYHRILSDIQRNQSIQDGMYVTNIAFEKHIQVLQKHFTLTSLSECQAYGSEKKNLGKKPFCILTFDDGWLDFYTNAFPILEAYKAPATVFLPVDYIGSDRWFWTDLISNLLSKWDGVDKRAKPSNEYVKRIESLSGPLSSRIEQSIEMLKALREDQIKEIIVTISERWGIQSIQKQPAFLSWEQVRKMQQSGLISFGSHTVSHRILTTLDKDEVMSELIDSKKKLLEENAVSPSFIPFCYPNGNHNQKIAEMVKKAGYSMAVTTKNGWNDRSANPFTLKRIGIHQDMSSTKAMFACKISEMF